VISLTGYTSSSRDPTIAMNFAFDDLSDNQVPVVFEIKFKGKRGLFEMSEQYTAYPGEDEVLIQDGLQYRIIGVE